MLLFINTEFCAHSRTYAILVATVTTEVQFCVSKTTSYIDTLSVQHYTTEHVVRIIHTYCNMHLYNSVSKDYSYM